MGSTVFVPDVTSRDWASLIALCVVALMTLALALVLYARTGPRSRAASTLLAVPGVFIPLALLAARQPQFSEVSFSDSEMVVSTLGTTTRLAMKPGCQVRSVGDSVRLVSGSKSVDLPLHVAWKLEGLVVDANYLANEFKGRAH